MIRKFETAAKTQRQQRRDGEAAKNATKRRRNGEAARNGFEAEEEDPKPKQEEQRRYYHFSFCSIGVVTNSCESAILFPLRQFELRIMWCYKFMLLSV